MTDRNLEPAKMALRREIIFGRRRPGSRLVENDIAEAYGIGRHIVRSVFVELERMGLVERRPNRGVVVIEYGTAEIDELYEMRELLQRQAVARIPMPVPRKLLNELRAHNGQFLQCLADNNLDGAVEANNSFHRSLFDLCQNRFLSRAIEDHWQRSSAIHSYGIGTPSMATESHKQHAAMIEALENQDRQVLADLCTDHMKPALRAYQAANGHWQAAVAREA